MITKQHGRTTMGTLRDSSQTWLFPVLADESGALDEKASPVRCGV